MTTPVPVALPSFVRTGRVRGKAIVVGTDTASDVDTKPDAYYPQGSVLTFVLSTAYLLFDGPSARTTVYLDPIVAKINASGDPVTADGSLLELPQTVDQDFANDLPVYWICTPTIRGREYPAFRFDVSADVDNYLTDQQILPAGAGDTQRGPRGASVTSVSFDSGSGELVFGLSDGSSVLSGDLASYLHASYRPLGSVSASAATS